MSKLDKEDKSPCLLSWTQIVKQEPIKKASFSAAQMIGANAKVFYRITQPTEQRSGELVRSFHVPVSLK